MYIIGALIPLGGLAAGPIYLGYRWWYGSNRELDNAEKLHSDFKSMIDEFNEIIESIEQKKNERSK